MTKKEGLFPKKACDRCTAIKPNGEQCDRITCIVGPMCWQHTRIHYHVRVKPAKHGMGLFADKPGAKEGEVIFDPRIQSKKFICWYAVGKRVAPETITTKDVNIPYAANTGKNTDIFNPYKTNDFPGRYANDPNDISKPHYKERAGNCTLVIGNKGKYKNTAYLNAIKKIKQGEEIVWSYGAGYWNKPAATEKDYTGVTKRTRKIPRRYQ